MHSYIDIPITYYYPHHISLLNKSYIGRTTHSLNMFIPFKHSLDMYVRPLVYKVKLYGRKSFKICVCAPSSWKRASSLWWWAGDARKLGKMFKIDLYVVIGSDRSSSWLIWNANIYIFWTFKMHTTRTSCKCGQSAHIFISNSIFWNICIDFTSKNIYI